MATESKTNLVFFSRINNFVNELDTMYGSKYHPLKLYKHMLSKTNISHFIKINRNIDVFTAYITANKQGIINKKELAGNIVFSKNIYIPVCDIVKQADTDNKEIIFQHLVALLACIDTSKEVSDVLKNIAKGRSDNGETEGKSSQNIEDLLNPASKEGMLFNDVLGKIEKSIDPEQKDDNPMNIISSLMKGNVIQDVISTMSNGMKDGSLDINRLFGMVQGMLSNFKPEGGSPSGIGEMLKNIGDTSKGT